ncbi:MAG: HlyC/CorC family transporter [Lachnospiraceae bacterium]|nr:HlyC/CorC family transporter [Lachnospiraceae bacterium]
MSALIITGIGIIACIILSGVFSAAEMAISSCNRVRMENEAKDGNKKAARVLKLTDSYDNTLSTILLSNNLVNIAASSLSTVYIILLTGSDDLTWLMTVVVTVLVIIFGETIPKIISKRHANSLSQGMSGFIMFLYRLLWPVNFIVVTITAYLSRPFGKKEVAAEDEKTEELQAIIETAEDEGVIDSDRSEIVAAAIDFSDVSASDVMTARVDIEAIDIDDPVSKVMKQVSRSRKSRFPVYRDSIDNIIGVMHLNPFLKAMASGEKVDIEKLMNEPCYVYKTAKLPHVLDVLKDARQHLAIVTDEYSGTLGIVTMEDVLEEIVGDIWDDNDEIEEEVVESETGELIVDGDMPTGDFLERLGIDEDDWEYESQTAGGWAIEYMEDFPKEGDAFDYKDFHIVVSEAEERRVVQLTIMRTSDTGDET